MEQWYVTPEYHLGEKIFVVVRDNLKTGQRETVGTFDDAGHAQEFANALNKKYA